MSNEREVYLRKLRRQGRFATAKLTVYILVIVWLIWTMYSDHQRVAADRIRWDGELQQMDQMQKDMAEVKEGVEQLNQVHESVPVSRGSLRTMVVEVTGYCPCDACCGKHDGITASGAKATEGRTVAAGTGIPFGSDVYIPGAGWRVVEDRGGAITDGHMDLFFSRHEDALAWGRQMAEVVVR